MAFVSMKFLFFLLVVCGGYFIMPAKLKWVWLLICSYTFYLLNDARAVAFIIFTTVITYITGRILGKINRNQKTYLKENKTVLSREEKKCFKAKNITKKKWTLFTAILANLGLLVFLKYFNFFAGNINAVLSNLSLQMEVPILNLMLPLGISFYTLQALGYLIDVYRDKYEPDRNLAKFALFLSFFPQIVQGPIARYNQLAHQLYEAHKFEYKRVAFGAQLILWGFMKKLIIADRLAPFVDEIFNNYVNYQGITLFLGALAYGFQVYTDFSGGMDIARGAAQILGIDVAVNFERPYFARSISEFWRRWHITLGSWMKDYVFYPLALSKGFNKLGKRARNIFGNYIGKILPTFLSMFIVFLLVGVWHGSSWKYVAYGIWNGVFISGSILLEPVYEKIIAKLKINTKCFSWGFFQAIRTIFLCSIGRFFSRGVSCMAALRMIKHTFTVFNPWVLTDYSFYELGINERNMIVLVAMGLVLLVVGIMQERGIHIREKIAEQNLYFRWLVYLGALAVLLIFGVYGNGLASTVFIYQQF